MGLFDSLFGGDSEKTEQLKNPLFYPEAEKEIDKILSHPGIDQDTARLADSIKSDLNKVREAGLDPDLATPRSSLFMNILDTIDAPRQGVAGVIDAALRGDIFTPEVGTGFRRGQIENTTASDIFRRHDIIDNPIARGVVGFGADVLTDPLNWLTFGAGAGVKAGGRVLTEAGESLSKLAHTRAAEGGLLDALQSGFAVDDAFKNAANYQEALEGFNRATKESTKAFYADKMAKAQSGLKDLILPEELAQASIFSKPKLNIGLNVPFLGHVIGDSKTAATKEILEEPGPIGQAFRLAGEVFKPGKISLGEIELSDDMLRGINNIRLYANNKLFDLNKQLEAAKEIPVLGLGADAAQKIGQAGKAVLDKSSNLFKKVFYQKALTGADFHNNRLDLFDLREGNKAVARHETERVLGDLFTDKDTQKEVVLAIDAQAFDALKDSVNPNDRDVLGLINKIRGAEDVSQGDQLLFRDLALKSGAEENFRSRIDNLLTSNQISDKVKAGIQRTIGAMDELAMEEGRAGLGYSRLEYYIPHRYSTANQVFDGASKAGAGGKFFKARKYATLEDAFTRSGKVGDTDLAELLNHRIRRSLDMRAERDFAHRVMIEEGLNPQIVAKMYQEALLDPSGEAAQVLRRNRINLQSVNESALKEGAENAAKQRIYRGIGTGELNGDALATGTLADFQQKVNEELWANGKKPLDNLLPQQILGEIGDVVSLPGGEKVVLPHPIANAMKETIANKDILKEALSGSEFGRATLKMFDHGMSTFKKIMTLPFPAYWGQNFLGDRFRNVMTDIHTIDPGLFQRTYDTLAGKIATKNVNGVLLGKDTLEEVAKRMGMRYSANEYLGTMDTFSKMDIDKHLAKKGGMLQNIVEGLPFIPGVGNKSKAQAGLEQLHDKFQFGFDGFFRMSAFLNRFEKGDTIPDAIRSANDLYFNYRDMSDVERSLFRRFFMFYGYMSKATKSSLTALVTAPGQLTTQLHSVNALAELFSDPDAAPTAEQWESKMLQSAVSAEQLSRPIGRTKDGRLITGRGFAAPLNAVLQQFDVKTPRNFSVGELIDSSLDSAQRTIQKQFASSNPAINAMSQLVSGKNLYFDKPLDAEFLRKLPSLNSAAEKLAGLKHNELPIDLDAATKAFLGAVPDGKGRLIANKNKMWILMNLVPGLSRATSMAGALTRTDIPTSSTFLRTLTNVNLDESDLSRSMLSNKRAELDKFMSQNSVRQRLKNLSEGEDND